jgi:hypothetical protein
VAERAEHRGVSIAASFATSPSISSREMRTMRI